MGAKEIPVYLLIGFLDAGITTFLNGILEDGFARETPTLLLSCEEGEVDYEPNAADKLTLVTVEDESALTPAFLRELEARHQPGQVIIEYNGMWPLGPLLEEKLPEHWIVYQTLSFVAAPTFELYAKNMGQLMMEKLIRTNLLVFNRCTEELKLALRQRNLRLVNRRADIFLEDESGQSEDYQDGSVCPFDLSQPVIEIADEDFGLFYVDATDHPDRWDGKQLRLRLVMCRSEKLPGEYVPGRFAMVCCEKDVAFLALVARGELLSQYETRQWLKVRATVRAQEHPAYGGLGPVLMVTAAAPCDRPANEVVNV
jgi:hypothetical protein